MDIWGANQLFKPDNGYGYKFDREIVDYDYSDVEGGPSPIYANEGLDVFYKSGGPFGQSTPYAWPSESAWIMPYIVQARSKAMGRIESAGGEINEPLPLSQFVTGLSEEHSGIFNFTVYETVEFWDRVKGN